MRHCHGVTKVTPCEEGWKRTFLGPGEWRDRNKPKLFNEQE